MIIITYLQRIGYDWHRITHFFKEKDRAHDFMMKLSERLRMKNSHQEPRYRNIQIFEGCKKVGMEEFQKQAGLKNSNES